MKMDFAMFFFAFTLLWRLSSSIRCYRCEAQRTVYNAHLPLCKHFDSSDKFIVECEFSTMCFKKETSLNNVEDTTSVERDCALQTRDDEQVKVDNKWVYVKIIHEIYNESCEEESRESGRSTKTTKCYCRGDLCNSATEIATSCVVTAMAVGLWLLLN